MAETTTTLPTVTVTVTVEPNGLKARTTTITTIDDPEPTPPPAGPSSEGGTTFPAYASACSVFPSYVAACSCVGVTAETTTLPTPSTTLVITSGTATVSPTATATVTNIVVNGGFETGDWAPWVPTRAKSGRVYGDVAAGGKDSMWAAMSNNMYDNNLWEFYQVLIGKKGTTYQCSYDWKFTDYYEVEYSNGNVYVPYIHGYLSQDNHNAWTIDTPDPNHLNEWQTTTFEFKSTGKDTWYFDCASPQPRCGEGHGSNHLSIDNVVCIAKPTKK